MILTRFEKEQLVLYLYNQGKGTREISREVKMSFSQIGAILKRASQQKELGQVQVERTSVSTQAYELFSKGKTVLQVAIELRIKSDEAIEYQKEYWTLQQLNTLHQVYDTIRDDIWIFVDLYKLIKGIGMDQKHVKRLLEIANNDLPSVEERYDNLCNELKRLNYERQSAAETIQLLNSEITSLRKTAENNKSKCEELESKKRILYLKKIRLESVIERFQKCHEYHIIVQIVKQQMKNIFGEDKQLLRLAFESVIESLLRDPFRLESFIEYAISTSTTLTSPYQVKNKEQDTKPGLYDRHYLSPDLEGDRKQVESLKNLILNESEKIYDKKRDELTNMVVSEVATYDIDNNQPSLTYNEKQNIKELLLLEFTESENNKCVFCKVEDNVDLTSVT